MARVTVHGYVHPDFQPLADDFSRQLAKPGRGGASLSVYFRGHCVADVWASDPSGESGWSQDSLAMCFSTTKGVASTALHICAARGLIDYDKPVAEYWPEFAAGGKSMIRVRDVLCHSAGLHGIRRIVDRAERLLDWDHMTSALAAARPSYVAGTAHGYHALTYGWLTGELVRRVSDKPLAEFVRDEIAAPLGLDGLHIGCPEADRGRIVELRPVSAPPVFNRGIFRKMGVIGGKAISAMKLPVNTRRLVNALVPRGMNDLLWSPEVRDATIPSANGFFDARSLAKMYALIANGGSLDGERLLSRDQLRRISLVQTRGLDRVLVMPMRWRLGYHMVGTTRGILPDAFGHYGFGGSGGWADLSRNLSLAFVPTRGTGTPVGDLRILRSSTIAVACADRIDEFSPEPEPDREQIRLIA